MSRYDGNFVTALSCAHVHTTKYLPPGEEIYCKKCASMQTVLTCLKKYTWRCHTCLAKRSYISSRLRAEGYAMRHYAKDRSHHVIFTDMDGKVYWDSHPSVNRQLPLF